MPELLASIKTERNMEMVFFINPQKYEKSLNKKVIYALNLKTNQQKGPEIQFQTPVVCKIFFLALGYRISASTRPHFSILSPK